MIRFSKSILIVFLYFFLASSSLAGIISEGQEQNNGISKESSTDMPIGWYSQRDSRWNSIRLGSESQTASDCTIGNYGCAMTCGAMLNHMEISGDSSDVTPNDLNTWLINNNGYQYQGGYAIIVWSKIADMDGQGGLIYNGFDDIEDNWAYLDTQLDSGRKVIVKVTAVEGGQSFEHWVLVVDRDGDSGQPGSYKVYDPFPTTYESRTLARFYNSSTEKTFFKSRTFSGNWRTGFDVHDSIQVLNYWGRTMCYDNDLYQGSTGPWTTPYDWDTEYREGDFRVAYRIKNMGSDPVTIEHLVLSIYNSENNFVRYTNALDTGNTKIDANITLQAGQEYRFDEAKTSFTQNEINDYRIIAEAIIDGEWYQIQNKDYQFLKRDPVGMTVTVTAFPLVLKKLSSPSENQQNIWEIKTSYYQDSTGKFEASYELQNISSQPVNIVELFLTIFRSGTSKIMNIPGSDQNKITNIVLEPGGSLSFPPPQSQGTASLNQTNSTPDMAYYDFSDNEGGIYKVIAKSTVDGQTVDIGKQDLQVIGYPALTSIQITGWPVVSENSGAQYTCTAYYSDGSTANVSGEAAWTLEGAINASLNNSGYLTTYEISANDDCRIRASYGGMYDLFNVTIENSGSNLQAPYNLTASKGTYTDRIEITWSIAPNTDKVSIERKKNDMSWISLGWTESLTSYTDTSVETYDVYYYRVQAHNTGTGDVSPESNEDSGFLKEPGADEKTPQNVNATCDHAHFIQLTCDWMAGIDGWKVYRSGSFDGAYTLIKTYDDNTGFVYNDYSAEPGIYYYYKLTTYGSFGESPSSSPVGGCKLLDFGVMSPVNGSPGNTVTLINSEYPPAYPFGMGAQQGTVYFGTTPAAVTSWSNEQVTAIVPEGSGTVEVTVTSPAGISSINSKTFTYEPPPTLTSIEITGPTEVEESSGAQYNCTAYYSNGSTADITGAATWSVDSSYATINNSGYLTTSSVPSDQPCRISFTYTESGVTKSGYQDITIFKPKITVTTPNGGESFEVNSTLTIDWETAGTVEYVKIEYSTDNGGNWVTESDSVINENSYLWTIPDNPSHNCLIRISNASGGLPSDESNAVFSIVSGSSIGSFKRVSINSDGITQGDGPSQYSSISGDGRYIAFASKASTLVDEGGNGSYQVYVHDRDTGQTELVSRALDGGLGNGTSNNPSISSDGRYVAFQSNSNNLVTGYGIINSQYQIYLYDRQLNQTSLVTVSLSGGYPGSPSSFPMISPDGNYIVFDSESDELVPGDTNPQGDVFCYDRTTGQIQQISSPKNADIWQISMFGSISSGGRYVVFMSKIKYVPTVTNDRMHIYLYDRQYDQFELISASSDGTQADQGSYTPSISADGNYVVFDSYASTLVPEGGNGNYQIFLRNRNDNQIELISKAPDGSLGNGDSSNAVISNGGRYVVFKSSATNLASGDTNGKEDIFVYDKQTLGITRISVLPDGTQPNGDSRFPAISGDGSIVGFDSDAGNLVSEDTNGVWDVFVTPLSTTGTTTYTITVQQGTGYTISPGTTTVSSGSDMTFTIAADSGYLIQDVIVNGNSYGPQSQFTFYGITQDHTLSAVAVLDTNGPGDIDDDGDGWTENQGDCRDDDETIYPGAPEIRGDGIDQDCNGSDLSWCGINSEYKITANDGQPDDWFGYHSISVSGDYAIVGALFDNDNGGYSGSAYIFKWNGNIWIQTAKLTASDAASNHRFGNAVAICGDYAIVGAYMNGNSETSGAAYIFKRNGEAWIEQAKLVANDEGGYFGISVGISGDYAIIGAPNNNNNAVNDGAAYIFKRNGETWTLQKELIASDGTAEDLFGHSVAISGDNVVVAAIYEDIIFTNSGSAYVFHRNGTDWIEQTKLTASSVTYAGTFGHSLCIEGDSIIVGENNYVYAFKWNGSTWIEEAKLRASDWIQGDSFGCSVALTGDYAVIGAYTDDDNGYDSGSAYVFKRNGSTWVEELKITASDGSEYDFFGASVSISGSTVIVGAYLDDSSRGSVYAYNLCSAGTTTCTLIIQSTPDAGIPITVTPNDKDGNGDGNTMFTRTYDSDTTVTLTAPSTFNSKDFVKWTIDGQDDTNPTIQVTMNANRTAEAYYAEPATIMVSSPNGGETWQVGSTENITWTTGGIVGNVKIEYTADNGSNWLEIVSSTENDGTHPWTVPNTQSDQCLVRINDIGGNPSDTSDSVFSIFCTPDLTITSPNGGESFLEGSNQSITWISNCFTGDVTIEYSIDNGANWTSIVTCISNNGNYTWTVPDTPSTQCLVRISECDGDPMDISDSIFTIEEVLTPSIPEIERNALIALYNSSGGDDNWTDKSGWKTAPLHTDGFAMPGTEGSWFGITVENINGEEHVTRIELGNNNLSGIIPLELNQLNHLVSLNLANNQLTGTIPPELGALGNLEELLLYNNDLEGGIPVELAYLTKLKNLDLEINPRMSDSFPDWVVNLENLWNLRLGNCGLTGTIPTDIGNLTNLITLILSNNQLTGTIPPGIGNLANLNYLSLSNNSLSGSIPAEFCNLLNLEILYIQGNKLTGIIPPCITNLVQLDSNAVYIGYNGLYTDDDSVRDFLNSKAPDWEETQTVAPSDVSATATTCNSIEVSWTPITYTGDTGGYTVSYSTGPGGAPIDSIDTGSKTDSSLTVTGLTESTTYYFTVQTFSEPHANNKNKVISAPSQEVSGVTPLCPPLITVTSPNGEETLVAGSNHEITWNSTGNISNVVIEYSTDNGGSWRSIEFSTENDGSYEWIVPDTPSENCLVRISGGTSDDSPSDTSDETFTIVSPDTGSITVISPNGGETWEVGSIHQITWTSTGFYGDVKIEYSFDNRYSWTTITPSTDNDGSYDWAVPNTPSDNCFIRISRSDSDKDLSDTGDGAFSIIPASSPNVTVISPNGGEKLKAGTIHTITWVSSETFDSVTIEYSIDNGANWTGIIASTPNSGMYEWLVPDNPSDTCLIRISEISGEPSDISDEVFSIIAPSSDTVTITSPNGGEILTVGTTHEITWTYTGTFENVTIRYSTDNGTGWTEIIASISNTGSYEWLVPDTPSDECLVSISGGDSDESASDTSDAVFSIVPANSLSLSAPNGNEILPAGGGSLIKWRGDPRIQSINLEYSPDNGSTYLPIAERIPNTGSYEWQVPYHFSSNCLVRISSADGIEPEPYSLAYEFRFRLSGTGSRAGGRETFKIWLGDPLIPTQLNETLNECIPGVSIVRESTGSSYAYIDDSRKEIPLISASDGWQRLKVLINPETLTASLWLNGKVVFESHALKPGATFTPAVSFSVETEEVEGFAEVEIDDFTLHVLSPHEKRNRFILLLAEDFEIYEEGELSGNTGWKGLIEYGSQPVSITRDIVSDQKSLILQITGKDRVFVVKPFSLPANFPFDISDRPFIIKEAGMMNVTGRSSRHESNR